MERARGDSGIILLVALWSLVILGVLAISLGRGTGMNLALTRHAVARTQSKALAWAGLMRAMEALRQDSEDEEGQVRDTLFRCGVALDQGMDVRDVLGPEPLGEGEYEVSYFWLEESSGKKISLPGFQDEERRVNLNTIDPQNIFVLIHLIQLLGFDEAHAQESAYSLLDWKDADDVIAHADYGAENDYYQSLERGYAVKNRPLDSLEELLLVRGFDADLLRALRPWVTIFPKEGMFRVNFDTASPLVLRALARSRAGAATNTNLTDADALVDKMVVFRNGPDGIAASVDDPVFELSGINMNASERVLYLTLQGLRTQTSDYFRIRSTGRIAHREAAVTLDVVVRREDLTILSWRRE